MVGGRSRPLRPPILESRAIMASKTSIFFYIDGVFTRPRAMRASTRAAGPSAELRASGRSICGVGISNVLTGEPSKGLTAGILWSARCIDHLYGHTWYIISGRQRIVRAFHRGSFFSFFSAKCFGALRELHPRTTQLHPPYPPGVTAHGRKYFQLSAHSRTRHPPSCSVDDTLRHRCPRHHQQRAPIKVFFTSAAHHKSAQKQIKKL